MRKLLVMVVSCLAVSSLSWAQEVHISRHFTYPLLSGTHEDSVLNGLSSIRDVAYYNDVDGDGKPEIAVTNYNDGGHIHVFEPVGTDSLALVWSSPSLGHGTGSGNVSPRVVVFGDLDNDGKPEIICQSGGQGIYVFEWDGVMGSDNYGTQPSAVIGSTFLSGVGGNCEYMEVTDIDGDGQNELLVAYNAAANADDKYYVISAIGDWSTNDPGFSSFNVEYAGARLDLAKWGLAGGSPVAMISANFDGTGNKEILIHNWDHKNITVMTVPSADTYVLADTTNNKQNVHLGGPFDDVALFGGLACDIDNDGRDEVYLPTWYQSGSTNAGWIHMISYDPGSNTSEIDSLTNVTSFDLTPVVGPDNILGFGYGDMDGNGKKNLYFSGVYLGTGGFNIVSMEYEGGDKRNQANWKTSILYKGDSTIYRSITIKDSLGTKDTTYAIWETLASKIFARGIDIDNNGKEDILMPYQGWYVNPDSTTTYNLTWNAANAKYDTIATTVVNNKRWTFNVLEAGGATGVEMKHFTVITPDDYRLEQNYPNPFNPSTTISYYLPVRNRVSLKIYDVLGREVRTLMNNEERSPGNGQVVWDGRNNAGKLVVSGAYVYTLRFGNFEKSMRMMLVK